MAIQVKTCGITTRETGTAAARGGAAFIGYNFYPRSPRSLSFEAAAALVRDIPQGPKRVGLVVDADDEMLRALIAQVPLDYLQLHGEESPARLREIGQLTGKPLIKALKIARAEDLDQADIFAPLVDYFLLDAKAPPSMKDALPGGNALAFDWRLLAGRSLPKPWLLAGGLHPGNLAQAVELSGAKIVDVSSGIEEAPGVKSLTKIADFLEIARRL
jgi:phosphoribosylanthranilate isomerase